MTPLVVKDMVLAGNSGGEMGLRDWLIALNAGPGRIAWRAYNVARAFERFEQPDPSLRGVLF